MRAGWPSVTYFEQNLLQEPAATGLAAKASELSSRTTSAASTPSHSAPSTPTSIPATPTNVQVGNAYSNQVIDC